MATEWLTKFVQAVKYTGSNSAEVLSFVLASPLYTPANITVTIGSEVSGVLTLHFIIYGGAYVTDVVYNTGDWVIQSQQGPGAPSDVISGASAGWVTRTGLVSVETLGVGYFGALAVGASTNVDCTLTPTHPDNNYTVAGPIVITSLSVAPSMAVQSVTNLSGSVCRVNVKNNGLVALGGLVIVNTKRISQ